jgi:quercetin dioxygenase-like cupin family protein
MSTGEVEKSKIINTAEIVEYASASIASKTILKKITGHIDVISFDAGEKLAEKFSPFDSFVQIIDGRAEIIINKDSHSLEPGEAIIIPANTLHTIKANERFKMILAIIKSGYE